MKKVLHIMSGFGGGISSFILNKAEALKDSDIVFDVLTYDECSPRFIKAIESTNGHIYQMPNPKVAGWNEFYKKVNEVFAEQPKDIIVHSHIQGYRAVPFYLISKKNKIDRFIVHAHTDAEASITNNKTSKTNRFINNRIAKEKISCGIKASKHIFGAKSLRNASIMHIPNSIDENKFIQTKANKNIEELNILGEKFNGQFVIGSVARFHKQKNHFFMIDIIEQLSLLREDFLWVFVGDGHLREDVEQEISKRNLEKFVTFLGVRNDLPKLYSVMDLFVLPSLYEGLPTVAVEAQTAGLFTMLSSKITAEADLGIGLVEYIDIDSAELWVNAIEKHLSNFTKIDDIKIIEALEKKKFTNQSSAELYRKFLEEEIKHYKII